MVEKELEQYNFSFGNCQKLINMTVKYFYIVTYKNSSKKSSLTNVIVQWIE